MLKKLLYLQKKMMNNVDGHETQVFVKTLENVKINDIIVFDDSKDSSIKR